MPLADAVAWLVTQGGRLSLDDALGQPGLFAEGLRQRLSHRRLRIRLPDLLAAEPDAEGGASGFRPAASPMLRACQPRLSRVRSAPGRARHGGGVGASAIGAPAVAKPAEALRFPAATPGRSVPLARVAPARFPLRRSHRWRGASRPRRRAGRSIDLDGRRPALRRRPFLRHLVVFLTSVNISGMHHVGSAHLHRHWALYFGKRTRSSPMDALSEEDEARAARSHRPRLPALCAAHQLEDLLTASLSNVTASFNPVTPPPDPSPPLDVLRRRVPMVSRRYRLRSAAVGSLDLSVWRGGALALADLLGSNVLPLSRIDFSGGRPRAPALPLTASLKALVARLVDVKWKTAYPATGALRRGGDSALRSR